MFEAFSPSPPRSEMLPASRWTPRLARPAAGGGQARAVERLGAGDQFLAAGQQVPLLRQGDEFGAVGGRRAHQALGRGQVPVLVPVGVELYRRCAHALPFVD